MKWLFQIFLIIVMIVIGIIFYKNYFAKKVQITKETKIIINQEKDENKKNIIKNLKYNVKIRDSGTYEVSSDSSEIILIDDKEVILMKNVTAIFTSKNNKKLYIYSDIAEFDSSNYNTNFKNNIRITYENNYITSNKLNFDFEKNNILVYENVVYNGSEGKIFTDNIQIDLRLKNVNIFMNKKNKIIKGSLF